MIKFKVNKYQLASLVKTTEDIFYRIEQFRIPMQRNMERAKLCAYSEEVMAFNKKLRAKQIMVERKIHYETFTVSITEIQAYLFVEYAGEKFLPPYDMAVVEKLKEPIFQHLLI